MKSRKARGAEEVASKKVSTNLNIIPMLRARRGSTSNCDPFTASRALFPIRNPYYLDPNYSIVGPNPNTTYDPDGYKGLISFFDCLRA